ncbi:MAG: immunity protein Tsi6 family protein [Gammaproteobacteria bacterium]|nr:immunity protein Tsi6 family protein [Gammaproteobacteria bacterium]
MNKFKLINSAKKLISKRLNQSNEFEIYHSIDAQLNYLSELLENKISDRTKLKEINVGLYAIREFEESDPELSSVLKKIQFITIQMSKGLKVD